MTEHKEGKSESDIDPYLQKSKEQTDSSFPSGTPHGESAELSQQLPVKLTSP
jgi:hypothetical protein